MEKIPIILHLTYHQVETRFLQMDERVLAIYLVWATDYVKTRSYRASGTVIPVPVLLELLLQSLKTDLHRPHGPQSWLQTEKKMTLLQRISPSCKSQCRKDRLGQYYPNPTTISIKLRCESLCGRLLSSVNRSIWQSVNC